MKANPNEPSDTQEIIEEKIIIKGDDDKDKNKNIIKRTISNKNRVINQILEKKDPEEIISQNETTTKSKQKKGITRIKEEPIILNPEEQSKNIHTQYTANKNEVTEEQFEVNEKDQTKNKISEKKYPLNQYLKDILTPLGIETNFEIPEEMPKEDEKIVLKGKSKKLIISHGSGKDGQKEEDKKEEDKKEEDKKEKDDGAYRAKRTEGRIRWMNDVDFMDERTSNKVVLPHKWRTHPRLYGKDSRYCRVCRNTHGLIRKYGLNICRKCFRERAHLIGFKQTK